LGFAAGGMVRLHDGLHVTYHESRRLAIANRSFPDGVFARRSHGKAAACVAAS